MSLVEFGIDRTTHALRGLLVRRSLWTLVLCDWLIGCLGLAHMFLGLAHPQELVALLKQPIRNNKKNKKEESKKA